MHTALHTCCCCVTAAQRLTRCVCVCVGAGSGPGVEGVAPAEASERLQTFQAEFNQLWRQYTTCSGGEELFGLPVNGTTCCVSSLFFFSSSSHPLFPSEYPELQRIKRELSLLSKLYSLYNCVIDSVAGYYDILWADLNIEKINNELQDFQNKYSRDPDPDPTLRYRSIAHRVSRCLQDPEASEGVEGVAGV